MKPHMRGAIRENRILPRLLPGLLFLLLLAGFPAEGLGEGENGVSFRFSEYVYWQGTQPNTCLFVEMVNHSDAPANPILMEIQVFDDEGEEVYGYLDEVPDVLVPSGKTFCFQTTWVGSAGRTPRIVLSYPEDAEYTGAAMGFIESNGNIRRKSGLFEGVSFECRNPTLKAQTNQTFNAALYDSDGRIIFVRSGDTGRFPTAPDSSVWLYWSPYLSNPAIDDVLLSQQTEVASVRVFTCYPLEEEAGQRCGEYTYEVLEDGTAALTGCRAQESELTLPDQIDGYTVSVLREEAVADLDRLVSLTIPEGVTALDAKSIVRCHSLKRICFPASLSVLAENQFGGCPLTEILLDSGCSAYTVLDGVLFRQKDSTLIAYPRGITTTGYTVPRGTKAIGKYAFADCAHLQKVTLPEGLTRIGEGAFYLCKNLSGLVIPDTVKEIEKIAFDGTAISSIVLPEAVTSLADGLFQNCAQLKTVTLPRELISIGNSVFRNTAIETVSLPETVTSIGPKAFEYCDGLKEIRIPEAVRTIGRSAFAACPSLQAIHLSAEQSRFKMERGMLCDQEEQRVISCVPALLDQIADVPAGIQSIDAMVFSGMKNLVGVNLPDSLTRIGDYAFWDCISLKSIDPLQNLEELGAGAFGYCSSLEIIVLPDRLKEIREETFYDCTGLKTVTLPVSLECIGELAFRGCGSLRSLRLPETVTRIEQGAFANCSSLQSVVFPEGLERIGDNVFEKSPLVRVSVPAGSYAEQYCLEHQIPTEDSGESSSE